MIEVIGRKQKPNGSREHDNLWDLFCQECSRFQPPIQGTAFIEEMIEHAFGIRPDAVIRTPNNEVLWMDIETKYKNMFLKMSFYSFILSRRRISQHQFPNQIIFVTTCKTKGMISIMNEEEILTFSKDVLRFFINIAELSPKPFGIRLFIAQKSNKIVEIIN